MSSFLQKRPQPKPLTLEIIRKLPKAELHCHLDGSVRVETIIELAKEQGVQLPSYDVEELRKLVTVSDDCTSLVDYLRGFDITLKVLQKYYALVRCVYEICEDASRDGITYLEIRFAPILHTREGMQLSYVMKAVCEGRAMAEYRLPITCRIIVCGMRQLDRRVTEQIAEIAWRYSHQGVVGFDLAGPEEGFSSKNHRNAFDIVRKNCLNCTLHSGEAAGWESVQDSLRFCGAHRIGHGVRLTENEEMLNFVIDRRIALEMCPTSNVQTKACPDLASHPIRYFFDKGAVVVPCTDNVTVSGVTLSEEYLKLHTQFEFSVEEILMLVDNGFISGFLESSMRQRYRAEAMQRCIQVLSEEGFDVSGVATSLEYVDSLPGGMVPDSAEQYWHLHDNPVITTDVLRALPKADLHVRFNGSMSLESVWSEIRHCREAHELVKNCLTFQDLKNTLFPRNPTRKTTRLQRKLFLSVLQTPEQLARGMQDIFRKASEDGVVYLELMVRPREHTQRGLTEQQVVETVIHAKEALEAEYPIRAGLVLYVHNPEDDPIIYRQVAEMAVSYRDRGVRAYGVFGDDIEKESYKFYLSTFRYLKSNNVRVTISSGRQDASAVLTAIHEGGASRISGAYRMHETPTTVRYLANHKFPVELSMTEHLRQHTEDVQSFAGNVVRLFLDNDIRIVVCSFAKSFDRRNLSETLFSIVDACNLSIAEVLIILSHSYRSAFQPHEVREHLFAGFWAKAKEYLGSRGFRFLQKRAWFTNFNHPTPQLASPPTPRPLAVHSHTDVVMQPVGSADPMIATELSPNTSPTPQDMPGEASPTEDGKEAGATWEL